MNLNNAGNNAKITVKHTNKLGNQRNKETGVYMTNLLTRKIHIPFNNVGKNIKNTLENVIKKQIEGKCNIEGFIKPNSIKVLTYSSGILVENTVMFEVVFECLVCCPVQGMLIKCNVKNVTQAGIRATINEEISPIVAYVSRDHHYNNNYFNTIKENDDIVVRVIGQRYELNDPQVSLIGEIVEPKEDKVKKNTTMKRKPKLNIVEKI